MDEQGLERRAIASGDLPATKIQNKTRINKDAFDLWFKNGCKGTEEIENSTAKTDEVNWLDISDLWKLNGWEHKKDRTSYNFIDLFSGAGVLWYLSPNFLINGSLNISFLRP